jgi:hypothetical protein
MVRDQDRTLIEGDRSENQQDESNVGSAESPTVQDLVSARREQKRHVWVKDGDKLRAVEVVLGISDYQYAELLQGDLQPGQQVVVGTQTK